MKEYQFEAVIKASEIGKGGAYIEFPYDVEAEFGVKGRVKIKCFFEDIPYQGSLAKMGGPCHIVGMKKDIRQKLNKNIGDTVSVRLHEDKSERTVEVHAFLKAELSKDKALEQVYTKLSYTRRKEMNLAIGSAKREETQLRRLEKILEELKSLI